MTKRILRLASGWGLATLAAVGLPTPSRAGELVTIASFNETSGAPSEGLALDANGNIYGTTTGGPSGGGTVVEINQGSSAINTLASFGDGFGYPDGLNSSATIFDGAVYGTAEIPSGGGLQSVVYSVPLQGGPLTVIASIPFVGEAAPNPGVVVDSQGNIYGTSSIGGAYGYGYVWEIAQGSHTGNVIANFDSTIGGGPSAVTIDGNGNLFGTTQSGGSSGVGTVWELAKGSGTITTLASFGHADDPGGNPIPSRVAVDSQGNIYGATAAGGTDGNPSVWELAKGSGTITTLASFSQRGNGAAYGVSVDAHGNVYGVTGDGGAYDHGLLFEIAAGSRTITELTSFGSIGGSYDPIYPSGPLTIDANGNIFGTTSGGGAFYEGSVWEYTASVPEPSSLILGLIGLAATAGVASTGRRRGARSPRDRISL